MTERAILYARTSGDDRGKGNLQSQLADCREYALAQGYAILDTITEDDRGASGYDLNLPGINEAIDRAETGEFDYLITRDLERFARNAGKFLVFRDMLEERGVTIQFALENYEDSPEGKLMQTVMAGITEYDRTKISFRMTRGRRWRVKNGRIMLHGNGAPYGYRFEEERDDKGNITAKWLVVHEEEAEVIRQIFQWYAEGDPRGNGRRERLSICGIANRLTQAGDVPTWSDVHGSSFERKRGYGEWSESAVAKILDNECYIGIWHYGKRGMKKARNGDKTYVTNPREHWLSVEVPAIVDLDLWQTAQQRKEENKRLNCPNRKFEYLVGGRVKCGHCGSGMIGRMEGKKKKYFYYYCPRANGRHVNADCDNRYFRVGDVDGAVWNWLRDYMLEPDVLKERIKERQAQSQEAHKSLYDRLASVDKQLAQHKKKLERVLDLYLAGEFDKEILTERKARLTKIIDDLDKCREGILIDLESSTITDEQMTALAITLDMGAGEFFFDMRRRVVDQVGLEVTLTVSASFAG